VSIKSKIQALITAANTKTGESDATLTDAVQTLVDGYGGGGSDISPFKFVKGTITPSANSIDLTFPCGDITAVLYFAARVVDYETYISADNNGMGLGLTHCNWCRYFNRTWLNSVYGHALSVYKGEFDYWTANHLPVIDATNQTALFYGNNNVTFRAGYTLEYVMMGV